jgi:hypothetical protein
MPQGILLDGKKCSGEVLIDSSVITIDVGAFSNAAITSIQIPNSVVAILASAWVDTQGGLAGALAIEPIGAAATLELVTGLVVAAVSGTAGGATRNT